MGTSRWSRTPPDDRSCSAHGASWYLTKRGLDAVTLTGKPIVYRPRTRSGRG
jgi:hypothetical protein